MECERFPDEKILLSHGEIGHRADFDAHLGECSGCRVDVEEMRDVRRRYREGARETMPEPLRARLLKHRPRAGRTAIWQRFAPLAAAAVLLVVLVIPMLRRAEAPPDLNTISDEVYNKTVTEARDLLPRVDP